MSPTKQWPVFASQSHTFTLITGFHLVTGYSVLELFFDLFSEITSIAKRQPTRPGPLSGVAFPRRSEAIRARRETWASANCRYGYAGSFGEAQDPPLLRL
jgi:hypothetical protein